MKLATITTTIAAICAGMAQAKFSYTFYEDQFFKGASISGQIDNGKCYGVPRLWNDRIRSFALINQNNHDGVCAFFNDANCKGDAHAYSGIPQQQTYSKSQIPKEFDAKWSSWECVA